LGQLESLSRLSTSEVILFESYCPDKHTQPTDCCSRPLDITVLGNEGQNQPNAWSLFRWGNNVITVRSEFSFSVVTLPTSFQQLLLHSHWQICVISLCTVELFPLF